MEPVYEISLDAGSLGDLHGTVSPTSGIVRCSAPGTLDDITAARMLRVAIEDGRIDVPDDLTRAIFSGRIMLIAGINPHATR